MKEGEERAGSPDFLMLSYTIWATVGLEPRAGHAPHAKMDSNQSRPTECAAGSEPRASRFRLASWGARIRSGLGGPDRGLDRERSLIDLARARRPELEFPALSAVRQVTRSTNESSQEERPPPGSYPAMDARRIHLVFYEVHANRLSAEPRTARDHASPRSVGFRGSYRDAIPRPGRAPAPPRLLPRILDLPPDVQLRVVGRALLSGDHSSVSQSDFTITERARDGQVSVRVVVDRWLCHALRCDAQQALLHSSSSAPYCLPASSATSLSDLDLALVSVR